MILLENYSYTVPRSATLLIQVVGYNELILLVLSLPLLLPLQC